MVSLEHGKYTIEKWQEFLNVANERIQDNNYEEYHCELLSSIDKFSNSNTEALKDSFDCYSIALSGGFSNEVYEHLEVRYLERVLKECKVLIITTNHIEKAMLHYHYAFGKNNANAFHDTPYPIKKEKIKIATRNNETYYVYKWGKYWVAHFDGSETNSNLDDLLSSVEEGSHLIKPNVILFIGIAFGIDFTSQNIGDVIVSKVILPYNKIQSDMTIKPDRSLDHRNDLWLHARFVNSNGFLDDVTYGGVLLGDSVLSTYNEKDRLCIAYSESDFVVGGEKKGSTLIKVLSDSSIPVAIINGISDWGVDNNTKRTYKEEKLINSLQAYAMQKVASKCDILLNDKALFSSSKKRDIKIEKEKAKYLVIVNVVALLLFDLLLYSSMNWLHMDSIIVYILGAFITLISCILTIVVIPRYVNRFEL